MVFTVPTMLLAAGVPLAIAFGAGAAVVVLALPLFARVTALEAASMAMLVGVTTSLHAWSYTAALLLPAVCYAITRLQEPGRTRALAIICVGGTVWWLSASYLGRLSTPKAV
jgi:hypothetical protein